MGHIYALDVRPNRNPHPIHMDLVDRSSHFEFGQNWLSYARTIDDTRICEAERSLRQLLPVDLAGKSFLDIGCGSGLFSLAALRLGATPVRAIDIDECSVQATRHVLETHAPRKDWRVDQLSILSEQAPGRFDIVYSWGVLHHTGDMWRALDRAAACVNRNGHLAIALYRKTYLCPLWTLEKRAYTRSPKLFAPIANAVFKASWIGAHLLRGRNPFTRIRSYYTERGMSWSHNVHDWLGGFPYESTSFDEVVAFATARGFELVRSNARRAREIGLFGSGCDEYVFVRQAEVR